ncbi:biopolymer transporter ExbD [Methylococcus sp. EFPC2]|uniref:ExbD/TolR family protein n=1 Tax=Methylococcus sp. EFPC2 TaxID=2812648 RepID=UPI001966E9C3|nr:biopolymer transporter ExbD [Methylococcus sp. EFPC2]QSA97601.1 biopolymer transporter ExbD [Methylococcus sp. EFPC2]
MAFKPESSNRQAMSEINVTPLVDVMLVLLVVFIVTAPLLTQAVKVDLPKTEKTDPAPDQHLAVLVIDAGGRLSVDDQEHTLESLPGVLQTRLQADPELLVQFQVDKAVPYGRLAEAMAVAHKAGIVKLAFLTQE